MLSRYTVPMSDPHETLRQTLTPLLDQTVDAALDYLSASNTRSVAATTPLATLRQRLDLPLANDPIDPEQVIDDLITGVEGGLHDSTGPRFFGWVIGGSLPAALAADWLTSTWDQNAGLYATSPASAVVEETAGRWLKELLHLPAEASFSFTTGCQMAHINTLTVARHAVLARHGWNVPQQGLFGAPPIRVLTSTERHETTMRALRFLGIGEQNIHALPVDDAGRLIPSALQSALEAEPSRPTIVVLQAGDVNIGAFDDFTTLIPLARAHHAWVHIDGAMGLWANATPRLQHLLLGVEQADSWATDGHKWLNVPYDSGYAFVADATIHRAALAQGDAPYLTNSTAARDQLPYNLEFSRRARAYPTYAAIRQLGRSGIADLIDRCCRHCHTLTTRIGALPHAQLLAEPIINQGLVRFLSPTPNATEADHNAFTDQTIAAINHSGEAFFGPTTWRGKRAMRISVSNWQTTDHDIDRVVAAIAKILQSSAA